MPLKKKKKIMCAFLLISLGTNVTAVVRQSLCEVVLNTSIYRMLTNHTQLCVFEIQNGSDAQLGDFQMKIYMTF